MSYTILKLVNGEFLFGELVREDSEAYYIRNPLDVEQSSESFIIKPWCAYTNDDSIVLSKNMVMAYIGNTNEISTRMISMYIERHKELKQSLIKQFSVEEPIDDTSDQSLDSQLDKALKNI